MSRPHEEDNEHCWCGPDLFQVCPECEREVANEGPPCWRCNRKGLVEPYDEDFPMVIVHKDKEDGQASEPV